MTCESCIKDISGSLYALSGIQKVEANLKDQLVTIEGTGPSHPFDATHPFCVCHDMILMKLVLMYMVDH